MTCMWGAANDAPLVGPVRQAQDFLVHFCPLFCEGFFGVQDRQRLCSALSLPWPTDTGWLGLRCSNAGE
jgi:hypothetical protein